MVPIKKKSYKEKKMYVQNTWLTENVPKPSICFLLSVLLLFCTFYPTWFSEILRWKGPPRSPTDDYLPSSVSLISFKMTA